MEAGDSLDWLKLLGGAAGVFTIGDAILNHRKWFAETVASLGVTLSGVKNAIGVMLIGFSALAIFQGGNPLLNGRQLEASDANKQEHEEHSELDPEKLLAELPRDAKESEAAVHRRHALMLLTAREGGRTHVGLPIDLFEESKLAGMHPVYRCRICGREGRFESSSVGLSFRELSIQDADPRKGIKNPWPKVLPDYAAGFK